MAPENERVAALESHHRQPAARALDKHRTDLILSEGVKRFFLADVDALGLGRSQVDQGRTRQMVEEHDIGVFQDAAALPGNQVGIAGPRPDQIDLTHTP